MDDSVLIEAVRLRSEIYDKSHAGFKNPAIKEAAWKMVAEVVGGTANDCTAKWNTLHERLCKERRLVEMKSRSRSGASGRLKWLHASAMNFLVPHLWKRKSVDNLPPLRTLSPIVVPSSSLSPTLSSVSVEEDEMHDNHGKEQVPHTVIATSPMPTTPGSSLSAAASLPYLGPTGCCKKQKTDETAELFKETLSNLNKSIASTPVPQTLAPNDPDSLIGKM
ncbi:unnamed protein product [Lasius platythorax]|uniref:MADF domain-containing protein n=1 Tax=Lasius platythorax TaxID=488582 RepID=A0AAV2MXA7_9HYME